MMSSSAPTGAAAGNLAGRGTAAVVADGLETQTKEWTLYGYYLDCMEGRSILKEEVYNWIRDSLRTGKGQSKGLESPDQEEDNEVEPISEAVDAVGNGFASSALYRTNTQVDSEDQPTSIVYGFSILAKLWSLVLLYIPAFCVDSRLGVYPSRRFALASYVTCIVGFIAGIISAELVIEPSMAKVLPGLISNVYKLLTIFVVSSEIGYLAFGLFAMAYIVYWRRFFHDFILYYCSFITLPRSFQRREITRIFLITLVLSIFTEPFFAFMSLVQDVEQPFFWPKMPRYLFIMVKVALIIGITTGASLISVLGAMFPLITNYLVVSTAQHLKILLCKQMARFKEIKLKSREKHNKELTSLLDRKTKRLIKDYSCDTLTMDWPEWSDREEDEEGNETINELGSTEQFLDSKGNNLTLQVITSVATAERLYSASAGDDSLHKGSLNKQLRAFHENNATSNKQYHGSTTSSLLFLYKNLIKSLSELKGMIEMYESKFGSFHLILICVNGLIVAQWVVAGLTEARLIRDSREREALNAAAASNGSRIVAQDLGASAYLTPFAFRVGIGVVTFIISNISIFLRCNKLPSRMVKMRSRLFKMNVDLACSSLEQQLAASPTSAQATKRRAANPFKAITNQQQPGATGGSSSTKAEQEWQGLDQVWSLYDQVERMSILANFRLTTNTYYSKNCLLRIFGREVSLVLFYIQIIDIYSYV